MEDQSLTGQFPMSVEDQSLTGQFPMSVVDQSLTGKFSLYKYTLSSTVHHQV